MAGLSWDLRVNDKSDEGLKSFEENLKGTESKIKSIGKGLGAAAAVVGGVAGGLLAKGLSDNIDIQVGRAKLQGQLGLTTADAKKAGEVAGKVYGDNWGSSLDDVNEALKSVSTNLGSVSKTSSADLKTMTEDALALSSTFGIDVKDSTEAAGKMMKNGLAKNATEAFDIITKGEQTGIDKSGDFLDTLNEYSPQFAKLGIDGRGALTILQTGLQAGARDTDTIADAMKEFSIRAIDGSKLTGQGFKALGMNGKEMGAQIAKGGDDAAAGLSETLYNLNAMKDPVQQNIAGTALFGTQWEDTLRQILPAMVDVVGGETKVAGSTQKMADTVGNTAQGKIDTAKRSFEQWTQSMASSDSALGVVVTSVATFGGSLVGGVTSLATMSTAMKGTKVATVAMDAANKVATIGMGLMKVAATTMLGPWGLVILGIIALGVGLVTAYKKSETFRTVVNAVFVKVADGVLTMADKFLGAFEAIFKGLGKMPGKFGAPFRAASAAIQGTRDHIHKMQDDLNKLKSKKITITTQFNQITLYGSAGGHYVGSTFVKNAIGGPVRAGVPTIVGDGGRAEVFVPSTNGKIMASKSTAMRAGVTAGVERAATALHFHVGIAPDHHALTAAVVAALQNAKASGFVIPKGTFDHGSFA